MAAKVVTNPQKRTLRQTCEGIRSQLEQERSTFIPHWRDLSDFIQPRRARFNISDVNKGDRRNQKINDTTGTMAARTLRSGLMGGVTSPARPWFKLATPDPDLAEFGRVKEYLHKVQMIMSTSYLRSNLYNTLPITYGDLGTFGTAPFSVEEDFTGDVLHTQSFPVGSYMIAKDAKGRVNTWVRDFRMTVAQLINKFGKLDDNNRADWSMFSTQVRNMFERGDYNAWVDICHVIMPNSEYEHGNPFAEKKKFVSVYYERGNSGGTSTGAGGYNVGNDDTFLLKTGYDLFPILCPRWEVTGEDVYGTDCPGMTALPDIKSLQLGEKRSFEAIAKMVNPAMMAPTSMRGHASSTLPGDVTYVDVREGMQGFRPVHEVQFRIDQLEMKMQQTRGRIQRAYYEDLFLMLASEDGRATAEEIRGKKEERLLALGPVLEQLNQDCLDPLTDISFDIHVRQGLLPPPPPELEGVNLKVEYISIMAQAQKLIGIGGHDRFLGTVGGIMGQFPETRDKIDADQLIDVYADMLSVVPSIVRTDDAVAQMRAAQAEAAAKQQQLNNMAMAASTAKDLAQAPLDNDSALTAVVSRGLAGA